jgi:hypothetical protein
MAVHRFSIGLVVAVADTRERAFATVSVHGVESG